MKAIFDKSIFDHTHNPDETHIAFLRGGVFCKKCANYCQIVPDYVLPNWLRIAKRDSIEFRFEKSDIPQC